MIQYTFSPVISGHQITAIEITQKISGLTFNSGQIFASMPEKNIWLSDFLL